MHDRLPLALPGGLAIAGCSPTKMLTAPASAAMSVVCVAVPVVAGAAVDATPAMQASSQ